MSPARWLSPSPQQPRLAWTAFIAASASLVPAGAAAAAPSAGAPAAVRLTEDRHVVDTQAILTGPRWYLGETPRGHLTSARGDAVTVVLGRDVFTADRSTALMLELHLTSAIGGGDGGAIARAGLSLGLKARTTSRVELAGALVIADDVDPDHVRDLGVAPGALVQVSYDLDDGRPYSTRILLRTAAHRASDTVVTLDAFIGLGTRWP